MKITPEQFFKSQYPNSGVSEDSILLKPLKDISDEEIFKIIKFMFGWNNSSIRNRSEYGCSITSTDMEEVRERGETKMEQVSHELRFQFYSGGILISDKFTTTYSTLYDILRIYNYLVCFSFIDESNQIVFYSPVEIIEKGWAKYID